MMDNLRKATNHVVFKIIFAIIMLSFIFVGIGGIFSLDSDSSSKNYVAKVNNEKIDRSYYENEVSRIVKGKRITDKDKIKEVQRDVLQQSINLILSYEYAEKLGIRASDEQVKKKIRNQRVFHVNGEFDNEKYLSLLRTNGIAPDVYAESIRQELINQQGLKNIFESDFLLQADKNLAALEQQKRIALVAQYTAQDLKVPEFSDEELQEYYNQHKEEFTNEDLAKLEYTGIALHDLRERTKISDSDIARYYKTHKNDFISPEEKRFALIQVATEDDAKNVLQALNDGAAFKTLAEEKSMYPFLKKSAGDLGWFKDVNKLSNDFIEAAKTLTTKTQFSDIIKVNNGYAILGLMDIKPEHIEPESIAAIKIEKILKDERVAKEFEQLQSKIEAVLKEEPYSLERVSKTLGMDILNTGWLERSPSSGRFIYFTDKILADEIDNLTNTQSRTNKNSDIIFIHEPNNDKFYVMRVAEFYPKGIRTFELAKSRVVKKMRTDWIEKMLQEKVQYIANEFNAGRKNEIKNIEGVTVNSYTLTRDSERFKPEIIERIFSSPIPVNSKAVTYQYNYYPDEKTGIIFALSGVEKNNKTEQIDEKNVYFQQMDDNIFSFFNELQSKAKIKISKDFEL